MSYPDAQNTAADLRLLFHHVGHRIQRRFNVPEYNLDLENPEEYATARKSLAHTNTTPEETVSQNQCVYTRNDIEVMAASAWEGIAPVEEATAFTSFLIRHLREARGSRISATNKRFVALYDHSVRLQYQTKFNVPHTGPIDTTNHMVFVVPKVGFRVTIVPLDPQPQQEPFLEGLTQSQAPKWAKMSHKEKQA